MNGFRGRVALVSGGATGVGAAAARLYAEAGAAVAIVDRNAAAGEALAQELRSGGHKAVFAAADVSRAGEVAAAVARVRGELGPVTVLFNHAGTIVIKPFLDIEEEE